MMTEQIRNKYNTLTPAEAKKLGKYLAHRQAPIRTASVLNKPRAPPIVVTNLDDERLDLKQPETSQQQQQISSPSQYHDSISNLSFKSSRDSPDCAHKAVVNRNFQTMSVDMGYSQNGQCRPASIAIDTMRTRLRSQPKRSNTLNSRIFDESFSSAKSDIINLSGRSSSATPTKFSYFPANVAAASPVEPDRSSSKLSLSSSTYKVFQSPLAKFKRLFRGIQRPFSQASDSHPDNQDKTTAGDNKTHQQHQTCARSLADFSLSDSLSQISLNKSQSPTVLPPALPDELRSLGYIGGGGVDYSNYDEFTKARNNGLTLPKRNSRNLHSNDTNADSAQQQSSFMRSGGDDSDEASWQMTSLPVYFERSLTTVFEEKQHPVANLANSRLPRQNRRLTQIISPIDLEQELKLLDNDEIYQTIKPPKKFDDLVNADDTSLEFQRRQPASPFRFSFGQPLSDSDKVSVKSNLGLPPRLPIGVRHQQQTPATPIISETNQKRQHQHDNSSSGNSSNCSSQMNVINYCDRQNQSSLDSSSTSSTTNTTNNIRQGNNIDCNPLTYSTEDELDDGTTYRNMTELDINDPDATIQSETSTIRGDNIAAVYANKCAEFERTVTSLKNKLIAKEKELTELQLAQLNSDYTIERLRERLGKLERENNQLRTLAAASNMVF